MEEKLEKQEVAQEVMSEWYAEKGIEEEGQKKEEKETPPSPEFVPSATYKKEEIKEEEGCKKEIVKKQVRDLLAIAEAKGLEKSISEARKMNDPFLLDVYHDVVAQDQAYKKFLS